MKYLVSYQREVNKGKLTAVATKTVHTNYQLLPIQLLNSEIAMMYLHL